MNQAKSLASVWACTPQSMAHAGVPLETAVSFHTRLRVRGPRTGAEYADFRTVRTMVARSP